MSEYWRIFVDEVVPNLGIEMTDEQRNSLLNEIRNAHDNYGMAHGYDHIPNPLVEENRKLSKQLQNERDKVPCETCKGKGYLRDSYGTRSSESRCYKCNGEGRHLP